jgi:hypothetical protein
MSNVTIGFVPRERFSLTPEALQRIVDFTELPYQMFVVDCAIPAAYREDIDRIVSGRDHIPVIRRDDHLLPNACRNLVVPEAKDVHFDNDLDRVQTVETPTRPKSEIVPRATAKQLDVGAAPRTEQFMETHCLFFRPNVFDRLPKFDEKLNTSEEIDVSLSLAPRSEGRLLQ